MVLDVNSGAVHVLDDLAFDILDYGPDFNWNEMGAGLTPRYLVEDIQETLSEIRVLMKEQMLFTVWSEDKPAMAGPPVIKAMCLHAAHDCNLRCDYCFASTGDFKGERSLLTVDIGRKALDFLVSHSGNRRNLEVDFFGGEPLMNLSVIRQVVEYGRKIEKQRDKKFMFTVTTNGLLLSDETIDYINQEFDNVVISIDGRPSVHDRMRKTLTGKNSYNKIAAQALKLAESRGQTGYYVRGTFTRYNKDFDLDVLHLANAGFKQISLEPVVSSEDEPYALTEADLPEVLAAYERLMDSYLLRRREDKGFNFFHFQVDLTQGPCAAKRSIGCGAGNEYVAVTPDGDIYPCHQFVGDLAYCMGSLSTGAFDYGMQAHFRGNTVFTKEACKTCWAKFYCSGGCPANGYHFAGSIESPYRLGCEMEKKRLECALAIKALEEMENNDDR